jgi:type VI secretion system protein ImpL
MTEPTLALPSPTEVEAALNLEREDWRRIQDALTVLGFDTCGRDGKPGANTRRAVAAWQGSKGQAKTGYLVDLQRDLILKEAQTELGQVLERINDEYCAKVLPFCRQAITGRFPFALGSGVEISFADLARLFGAGGLFDQFTERQLATYVDTAQRPWRWLRPIGSSNGALAPLELARRLRDGLFAGGAAPRAGFALKPLDLDPGAGRVALDLDGQVVSYAHGPVQPVHMDWPAPSGSRLVRLTFVPVDGGTPAVRSKEGPWGWFRLLQEAQLALQGRPDLYAVTFAAGTHAASFELQADSVDNPFDLGLFQRFRCPGGL